MKKFIKSILICLLIAIGVNVINIIYSKPVEAKSNARFEFVEYATGNVKIYRDVKTNVCYLILNETSGYGYAGRGVICVMVDKDGKPLLYNE